MKLENRYRDVKTGKIFKVVNFTTTLDCIVYNLILKEIDTENTFKIEEHIFRNNYVKVK